MDRRKAEEGIAVTRNRKTSLHQRLPPHLAILQIRLSSSRLLEARHGIGWEPCCGERIHSAAVRRGEHFDRSQRRWRTAPRESAAFCVRTALSRGGRGAQGLRCLWQCVRPPTLVFRRSCAACLGHDDEAHRRCRTSSIPQGRSRVLRAQSPRVRHDPGICRHPAVGRTDARVSTPVLDSCPSSRRTR